MALLYECFVMGALLWQFLKDVKSSGFPHYIAIGLMLVSHKDIMTKSPWGLCYEGFVKSLRASLWQFPTNFKS